MKGTPKDFELFQIDVQTETNDVISENESQHVTPTTWQIFQLSTNIDSEYTGDEPDGDIEVQVLFIHTIWTIRKVCVLIQSGRILQMDVAAKLFTAHQFHCCCHFPMMQSSSYLPSTRGRHNVI